jgi:DNA primase
LQVNPERQSWKCWVCNEGGDVFSFMMKMENVAFPEALAMLADKAGIPVTPARVGSRGAEAVDEKRMLFQAMAWAEMEFHECLLHDPQAAVARAYLAERGVNDDSVQRFRLGFAPDEWDWLLKRATNAGFSQAVLEKIGLAKRRERGAGFYDRFRGRVLFPIFDSQNRPVGVGGRVLPQLNSGDAAKYINSPETPLYAKSKLLYGLSRARDTIRKTGVALVMEGYTDTIMAHQSGFTGAVAACGTALTSQQIRLIGQCAPAGRDARILLVLDGDEAGRRRAGEMLDLFLAENADLGVLTLPDDADPCEFLLEHGPQAFQRLLDTSVDALTHAMRLATEGVDVTRDVHAASRALDKLVETIAKAPRPTGRDDHLRADAFLSRVARHFSVKEESLRDRMNALRERAARPARAAHDALPADFPSPAAPAPASMRADDLDPAERELMEILVREPACVTVLAEHLSVDWITSPACRRVIEACLDWHMEGEPIDFARLLLEFDDQDVKNLLVELDEGAKRKGAVELDGRLQDVLATFRRRDEEHLARSQIATLKEGHANPTDRQVLEDQLALMRQIEQQAKTRQGISAPMEG